MTLDVGERVGPFVVVANESTIPARKRRVVVRCVVCERVSEMNERSLLDKRTEEQRACAKCRVYTTNGTWTKGWRAKMENAAIEANRLNKENADLRDEIDKVMRERDEWRDKFIALNQTAGELCNACGWAFKIPGEPCRCEVVRERDEARAERDAAIARITEVGVMVAKNGNALAKDAYRRGAEAMREHCIGTACAQDLDLDAQDRMEERLRALPIPEEL